MLSVKSLYEAKDRPNPIEVKPVKFSSLPSRIREILQQDYVSEAHTISLFEIDGGEYYVIYETDEIGAVYFVEEDTMAYKDERGWNPPDIELEIDQELAEEIYDAVIQTWKGR